MNHLNTGARVSCTMGRYDSSHGWESVFSDQDLGHANGPRPCQSFQKLGEVWLSGGLQQPLRLQR